MKTQFQNIKKTIIIILTGWMVIGALAMNAQTKYVIKLEEKANYTIVHQGDTLTSTSKTKQLTLFIHDETKVDVQFDNGVRKVMNLTKVTGRKKQVIEVRKANSGILTIQPNGKLKNERL